LNNHKLYRTARWCALASVICLPFALILFMLSASKPVLGNVGMLLEIIMLLLFVFIFYVLSIAHRPESKWLGFAGMILFIASIVMDVVSQQYQSAVLFGVYYLLFSLLFLIFGYLGLRSVRMPRLLSVLALLTGGITFVAGVIDSFGNQNMADSVQQFSILFLLAWTIWLWRVLWSKKFAAASPEPATV
jgi:hypothetical protein